MVKNRSIIFDVDSTLVTLEALDFLASRNGCYHQVARLTRQAMNGHIPYHFSLTQKLALVRPSFPDLISQGYAYLNHLVPGVAEVISLLQQSDHDIWLLTGSFQPAVGILAAYLHIPQHQVITNQIYFNSQGEYAGFNAHHPLAHNFGKAIIINNLKPFLTHPVFIGDGATDLEAQPLVDLFIGFGGIAYRPYIAARSHIYLTQPDLRSILPFILG